MFPDFNHSGVIPPFATDPANRDGAPYETDLITVVNRLGTTAPRRALLYGLLDYRAALRAAGVTAGFQILDGSFTENCEQLRGVPPGDIDVVTFAHLPVATQAQIAQFAEQHAALFDQELVKEEYMCDAYFVDLGKNAQLVVEDTFYWYGLFSHQKNTYTWKGTLRVPLIADDANARDRLGALEAAEADAVVAEEIGVQGAAAQPEGAANGA